MAMAGLTRRHGCRCDPDSTVSVEECSASAMAMAGLTRRHGCRCDPDSTVSVEECSDAAMAMAGLTRRHGCRCDPDSTVSVEECSDAAMAMAGLTRRHGCRCDPDSTVSVEECSASAMAMAGLTRRHGCRCDPDSTVSVEECSASVATDLKENESVSERSSGAVSLDQGLSQPVSSEGADGEGIGLRSYKRLRFESGSHGAAGVESRAAGAPDLNPGRSVGGSRSLPGAAVPPCSEGEERSAESLLGASTVKAPPELSKQVSTIRSTTTHHPTVSAPSTCTSALTQDW
ncbi:UNVERIFIED_CONTAM: hypothetical protein FKN15_063842 [Acipenser sinensis]